MTDNEHQQSEFTEKNQLMTQGQYQSYHVVHINSQERLTGTKTSGSPSPSTAKKKNVCANKPTEYSASGLKHTLHPIIYQFKLLMLFLKRGLDNGYHFRLETEMDAAERFDDLVFKYQNQSKDGYVFRFL
jgi:hypothetical protein